MPEQHGVAQPRLKAAPEDRKGLTGFGSFGKPAVLMERLARILAPFVEDTRPGRRPPGASAPRHAAGGLMDQLNMHLDASARHPAASRNRMAGFFLYRVDGRIQIRVLTSDGWSHPLPNRPWINKN